MSISSDLTLALAMLASAREACMKGGLDRSAQDLLRAMRLVRSARAGLDTRAKPARRKRMP